MTDPIDILDGHFESKEEFLDDLREQTRGTFLSDLPDMLEDQTDLTWLDVINDRQDELVVDAVIGTEGLDADDLVEAGQLLRVLIEDDRCNWYDAHHTIGTLFTLLGGSIEESFETDTEFIEYVESADNDIFGGVDNIRETYRTIRQNYEESDDNPFSALLAPDTDLLFARRYIEIGRMLVRIVDNIGWQNEPAVGDYAVFTSEATANDAEETDVEAGEEFHIVGRFVDKDVDTINLADHLDTDDDIRAEVPSYKFQLLSYDDRLLDAYPEHFLVKADEDAEQRYLSPSRERDITIYDENPLPLDDPSN